LLMPPRRLSSVAGTWPRLLDDLVGKDENRWRDRTSYRLLEHC